MKLDEYPEAINVTRSMKVIEELLEAWSIQRQKESKSGLQSKFDTEVSHGLLGPSVRMGPLGPAVYSYAYQSPATSISSHDEVEAVAWSKATVPPDQVGLDPSRGAELHNLGQCSPCHWFVQKGGCASGQRCTFCHLCTASDIRKRKRDRAAKMKKRLELVEQAPQEVTEAAPSTASSPEEPRSTVSSVSTRATLDVDREAAEDIIVNTEAMGQHQEPGSTSAFEIPLGCKFSL